jgi:hypothetical protein
LKNYSGGRRDECPKKVRQTKNPNRARDMAEVVAGLPSNQEALNSNPSSTTGDKNLV